MKVLVTYLSQTGNTKKVAEAIFDELQGEKELKKLEDVNAIEGYDVTFVGFPVWQSGPAEPAIKFLNEHSKDKNIALFVTHAISSASDDAQLSIVLDEILEKCRICAPQANLTGFFDCQGELSEAIANYLLKSDNPSMRQFGGMRGFSMGHPNDEELKKARAFARNVIERLKL